MMKYSLPKAVIFDWDNTLVHSWERIQSSLNAAFKEFNMPLWTLEDTKKGAHRSLNDSFPEFFGDQWHKAREIFYNECDVVNKELVKPIDGAIEVLDTLQQQGIFLGVASNKTKERLHHEVDALGFRKYFGKAVVGSMEAAKDKPAPDHVFLALDGSGVDTSRDEVWYIGDTCTDIICAQNSNCVPILFGDKIAAPKIDDLGIDYHHVTDHQEFLNMIAKSK